MGRTMRGWWRRCGLCRSKLGRIASSQWGCFGMMSLWKESLGNPHFEFSISILLLYIYIGKWKAQGNAGKMLPPGWWLWCVSLGFVGLIWGWRGDLELGTKWWCVRKLLTKLQDEVLVYFRSNLESICHSMPCNTYIYQSTYDRYQDGIRVHTRSTRWRLTDWHIAWPGQP